MAGRQSSLLLFVCICALLWVGTYQMNRFPLKNKAKAKEPPKPKPKPPRINEAILPSLQEFLEKADLSEYFNDFVRMGFVDTKHCLRMQDMDYRLMQYEWKDMTADKVARLKASVEDWLTKATLPPEQPRDPGYEERKKMRYGRIYFPNSVQNTEYLLASFGSPPPLGQLKVVVSPTEFGCHSESEESQFDRDLTDSILVVRRGECTFLEKASEANRQHARVLIIVNNEDKLESPSSGLGIDRNVSEAVVVELNSKITVLSVANTTWGLFQFHQKLAQWTAESSGESEASHALPKAQVVPLKCLPGGKCFPLVEEEKSLQSEVTSGTIRIRNSANEVNVYEFLTSTFGGSLPTEPFPVAVANPFDACNPLEEKLPFGYGLLARRGDCSFDLKALNVEEAGGLLQIVIDEEDNALQRIGGHPVGSGYVGIASIFVSLPAGDFIESSIARGLTVTGYVTPYATNDISNHWIDLAYVEWAENVDDRLLQIEGHIQKHLQERNKDIVSWLRRQIAYIKEDNTELFAEQKEEL